MTFRNSIMGDGHFKTRSFNFDALLNSTEYIENYKNIDNQTPNLEISVTLMLLFSRFSDCTRVQLDHALDTIYCRSVSQQIRCSVTFWSCCHKDVAELRKVVMVYKPSCWMMARSRWIAASRCVAVVATVRESSTSR